jgi:hypothetical protein
MAYLDNFHVTLPSDCSLDLFPQNKPTCYRTKLAQRVVLEGTRWEVALTEFTYARPPERTFVGQALPKLEKNASVLVQYGNRHFFSYPLYAPPTVGVTFMEATAHLLEFLNKPLKTVVGAVRNVFTVEQIERTIKVSNIHGNKVTISPSLARFLNLNPEKPSKEALGTGDWDALPLKVFDDTYNDGSWWVSIAVSTAKITVPIPSQIYDSPQALLRTINRLISGDVKLSLRPRFTFDPNTKKVTLSFPSPYWTTVQNLSQFQVFNLTLSDNLAELMGFTPGLTYNDITKPTEAPTALKYIPAWYSYRVHTDIITNALLGDHLAPLLRTVQATDENFISQVFIKPYYRPLARMDFESILVYITNHLGEEIVDPNGYVSVTFHFRQRL